MNQSSTASLTKRRINCTFYPVVKQELLWMRDNKLINNTAFVYMALRLENPHCDRPIDINVKEFAFSWAIPESSVYEALAKLRDLKALKFVNKKVKIQWEQGFDLWDSESPDSQQEQVSGNPEFILESQNKLQNPRINSGIPENQPLEPLSSKDSSTSHTIQTSPDSSESGEEESSAIAPLKGASPEDSKKEDVEIEVPSPEKQVESKEPEKPILKIRDVPEEPVVPSIINLDLQSYLETAKQGEKPPEEIIEQLLDHPGYAAAYKQYAKIYEWECPKAPEIPEFAYEQIRKIRERQRR